MPEIDKLRAFLDSNVIFSGLYSGGGAPGLVLQRAAEGRFMTVLSRQVLDEVVSTIAEKLPGVMHALHAFLENIPLEVCPDLDHRSIEEWAGIVGEDDAPIAAAACAAEVDFLVSGDGHFLKARTASAEKGLRIVSPADILRYIP